MSADVTGFRIWTPNKEKVHCSPLITAAEVVHLAALTNRATPNVEPVLEWTDISSNDESLSTGGVADSSGARVTPRWMNLYELD